MNIGNKNTESIREINERRGAIIEKLTSLYSDNSENYLSGTSGVEYSILTDELVRETANLRLRLKDIK